MNKKIKSQSKEPMAMRKERLLLSKTTQTQSIPNKKKYNRKKNKEVDDEH